MREQDIASKTLSFKFKYAKLWTGLKNSYLKKYYLHDKGACTYVC